MLESYRQRYAELYRRHWWWRSRETILVDVIGRLELPQPAEILDFGCGDGLFFDRLSQWGDVRGVEVETSLVSQSSPHRSRIFHQPLGDPAYRDWQFDLITALDVLEHLENDQQAVSELLRMLRPGGKLVLTVPAFPALWDEHDEINRHFRRYRRPSLRRLLASQATVLELRYLFPSLFLPKWLVARWNRRRPVKVDQTRLAPAWIIAAMTWWHVREYRWLGWLRLPFGSSLLAVIEKRPNA